MPTWDEYKKTAKNRGALALELYAVETTPTSTPEALKAVLPAHLAYQRQLESEGKLFLAGPLSDETGELMRGTGLIIYRANSLEEANELAKGDPMHSENVRSYILRKWLINEGSPRFATALCAQSVTLS